MGFKLVLNANLEGLTDLKPVDTAEQPFEYSFEIECINCRERHPKPITINRFEEHDIERSKGGANFVFRCKNCRHEHSANIQIVNRPYTPDDNGQDVAFLDIDSRGMDFIRFIPTGYFQAKGADSTTVFNEIDLEEGEFYDYDDNASQEVSITEVKFDIVRNSKN